LNVNTAYVLTGRINITYVTFLYFCFDQDGKFLDAQTDWEYQ
jgi:hypothetical protein